MCKLHFKRTNCLSHKKVLWPNRVTHSFSWLFLFKNKSWPNLQLDWPNLMSSLLWCMHQTCIVMKMSRSSIKVSCDATASYKWVEQELHVSSKDKKTHHVKVRIVKNLWMTDPNMCDTLWQYALHSYNKNGSQFRL